MNEIIASSVQCSHCNILLEITRMKDGKLYYFHGGSWCPNGGKFFSPIPIATLSVAKFPEEPE